MVLSGSDIEIPNNMPLEESRFEENNQNGKTMLPQHWLANQVNTNNGSLTSRAIINPYATKSNIAASPASINPYATKSNIAASPATSINPYATNSNIAASPATSRIISNPYAVKKSDSASKAQVNNNSKRPPSFVGGSQQARLDAKKKMRRGPIPKKESFQSDDAALDIRMNPMERFFATLLLSPASDFLEAESVESKSLSLWETICKRVKLPIPTVAIQPFYVTKDVHFQVRAALVLEDSRANISQALGRYWKRRMQSSNSNAMMLTSSPCEGTKYPKISFSNLKTFSKDQIFNIRPGSIFLCVPRESNDKTATNFHLGVVVSNNRDEIMNKKMFTCMFFRENDLPSTLENMDWIVSPLCTLITELRAFEAMTVRPGEVAFWPDLSGNPRAKHTRFSEDGDSDIDMEHLSTNKKTNKNNIIDLCSGDERSETEHELDYIGLSNIENSVPNIKKKGGPSCPEKRKMFERSFSNHMFPQSNRFFNIPVLNKTQQRAATSFLLSDKGTITLVQGPPGTGKTTLLVNVVCQYLLENKEKRLMVCAPTNKAISVLASRFMTSFRDGMYANFNTILVGDADKLLSDERSMATSSGKSESFNTGKLSSIFLYTWMQKFLQDYASIKKYFLPGYDGPRNPTIIYNVALQLETRLKKNFSRLSEKIVKMAADISSTLQKLESGGVAHGIVDAITKLTKELSAIPPDNVWSQLMSSADVIFCTLSSAGGAALKRTERINDLIIDEAAASSEPEFCVPFHTQPERLLAVGDPLQLPAQVLSRRAIDLGLTKSLHERLMYDCNFGHIMLDVQYRMNPEISAFPSMRFYKSKIENGENVKSSKYMNSSCLLDRTPYMFLQVDGIEEQAFSGSFHNRSEAMKVVELVGQWRSQRASLDPNWFCSDRIRIITFYSSQVALIKRLLNEKGLGDKIVVATVDSSQGTEADVVIISFVRSQKKESGNHVAGFLTDDRRMNVALTRAKYQLVCIGNINSFPKMNGAVTMHMLADNALERRIVRPLLKDVSPALRLASTDDSFYSSYDDLMQVANGMTLIDLKRNLQSMGISINALVEKRDLVKAYANAIHSGRVTSGSSSSSSVSVKVNSTLDVFYSNHQ